MNFILGSFKKNMFSLLFTGILFSISAALCIAPGAYSENNLKITGAAGINSPNIPLADKTRPDIVLDPSLSGNVNVDISTTSIPDGTKVKIKFQDENNLNPPEGIIQNGKVTVPVPLTAGAVKVLYAETDPYLSELTSFSPQDIAKLKLWLKADNGVKGNSIAAKFTREDNQYLSIADKPSISLGPDQDFSIALWVNLVSKSASWGQSFINKDDGSGRGEPIEYGIGYNISKDRFRLILGNGSAYGYVDANDTGSIETGKWYFVVAWHDSKNDTLNIQVNNGDVNSIAWTKGTFDSSNPLLIGDGCRNYQSDPNKFYLDGRLQGIGFWKKVLAPNERASLYNSGTGKLYSDLTTDEKVNLIAWWNLNEKDGTRIDSHGGNNLTSYGVTSANGIVSGKAADGEPVNNWNDASGNSNIAFQLTSDYQPIYKSSLLNGKGGIRFDGIDDKFEALSSVTDLTQKLTTYFVASQNTLGNNTVWSTKGSANGDLCKLNTDGSNQTLKWSSPAYEVKSGIGKGIPAYYTAIVRSTNYATGTVTWRANGKDIGTSSAEKRSISHDGNLTIGSAIDNSARFNGDIYEILIFEGEHTPKEVAQVESYLKTKYGL